VRIINLAQFRALIMLCELGICEMFVIAS